MPLVEPRYSGAGPILLAFIIAEVDVDITPEPEEKRKKKRKRANDIFLNTNLSSFNFRTV